MRFYPAFVASVFIHSTLIAGGVMYYGFQPTFSGPQTKEPTTLQLVFKEPPTPPRATPKPSTPKTVAPRAKSIPHNTPTPPKEASTEPTRMDLIPHPTNAAPTYPVDAKQEGVEGQFTLRLTVAPTGQVTHVEETDSATQAPTVLVQQATKAVRTWRFKRNQNTTEHITVPFQFVLDL
jgi:TonB family protein